MVRGVVFFLVGEEKELEGLVILCTMTKTPIINKRKLAMNLLKLIGKNASKRFPKLIENSSIKKEMKNKISLGSKEIFILRIP